MPEEHALLSCSGSHIWLHCNPALRLSMEFEKQDTVYTLSGTYLHSLGEYYIRLGLGEYVQRPTSDQFDNEANDFLARDYADYVLEQYKKAKRYDPEAKIFLERRVSLSEYAPACFGTADAIIVRKGWCHIIDFKSGFVEVSAEDTSGSAPGNTQLMLYLLGALSEFKEEYDIKKCEVTIIQPRIQNFSTLLLSAAKVIRWGKKFVKPNAMRAYNGEGDFCPGDHCKYCPAKIRCRARSEKVLEIAASEMKKSDLITDEEAASILPKATVIKKWVDDLVDYCTKQAIAGKEYPGMKLIRGKPGNRELTDETAAIKCLREADFKDEDFLITKLVGFRELDKLLKNRYDEVLGELTIRPEGKLKLVPETEKGTPINNTFNKIQGD